MKFTYRSTFIAGLVAASCLVAGTVHASTVTLVGDKIIGYEIFPNKTTGVPVASTANAVTVTDDASDTFGFGFDDRFDVDVNALSVTLTYNFATSTFFQPLEGCNCLLLAGLNFSDGSTISGLSIEAATGGFATGVGAATPFTLAARTSFGTNALTNFAFPTGPLSQALIDSDAENGEFVLIDVGLSSVGLGDTLTIGFTTTGGTVTPPNPDPNTSVVPLPASAWMLLAAMGGLIGVRRQRARV
jgi:hypothetical protein